MIRIYTDGACSKNPGPGGWAAILLMKEGSQQICGTEKVSTNNRMELLAVIEALNVVLQLDCIKQKDRKVEVYSDSAYVINAFNLGWIIKWRLGKWQTSRGEVKNRDLWERALRLVVALGSNKFTVKFIKVKGHSGDFYNEKVDKLAKEQVRKLKI